MEIVAMAGGIVANSRQLVVVGSRDNWWLS